MDPIVQAILEILGQDIARRVFRPPSEAVEVPADKAVREGTPGFPSTLRLDVNQMQGPPCDITYELYEDRLFDKLIEEEEDCGCHQR
jgi:hypothetical protein